MTRRTLPAAAGLLQLAAVGFAVAAAGHADPQVGVGHIAVSAVDVQILLANLV